MSKHNYAALEAKFEEIIKLMPPVFSAHRFILRLAEQNQQLYYGAMGSYSDRNDPTKVVHNRLAHMLYKFRNLVERYGVDRDSRNIWGKKATCSRWRRKS